MLQRNWLNPPIHKLFRSKASKKQQVEHWQQSRKTSGFLIHHQTENTGKKLAYLDSSEKVFIPV